MSRSASGSANRVKSGGGEKKDKQMNKGNHHTNNIKEESSSSDDDDEPIHAPIQLKIEFVNSVMFRQWDLAKKLCQFMLMYEPDNSEAKQFAPLIDYMLTKEESSSSDDDTSDDDDDDDDDDDANGDSSESSSSTSSANEEEQATDTDDAHAPKPVNASLSQKCAYHK